MKLLTKLLSLTIAVTLIIASLPVQLINAQENLKVAIVQIVSHPSLDEIVQGVKDGLAQAGYVEGENLEIDFQNAEGDMNILSSITETVIANNPDLIFAVTTPVSQAFAQATTDIPIILTGVTDPVGAGLAESLDQPGGNITGVSDAVTFEEQFELIKSLTPEVKTIGMLYTTSEDSALAELEAAAQVAKELGYETIIQGIDSTLDMQLVAEDLSSKVDAIFVGSDNTIASAFETLVDATDAVGVPVYTTIDTFVKQGALAAVAIKQGDIGLQAAAIGIKVLEGTDPGTNPIEFVKNKQSVYNQETADHLGIEIPADLANTLTNVSE